MFVSYYHGGDEFSKIQYSITQDNMYGSDGRGEVVFKPITNICIAIATPNCNSNLCLAFGLVIIICSLAKIVETLIGMHLF